MSVHAMLQSAMRKFLHYSRYARLAHNYFYKYLGFVEGTFSARGGQGGSTISIYMDSICRDRNPSGMSGKLGLWVCQSKKRILVELNKVRHLLDLEEYNNKRHFQLRKIHSSV